jgi:hypothetical protein
VAEDVDDDIEIDQMLNFIKKSSDATLMLNLITPYLLGEKKNKLSKVNQDLIEVIQMLVVNQMKLQNDFRALLMYLNKKEMLDFSDEELTGIKAENDKKAHPETLYC